MKTDGDITPLARDLEYVCKNTHQISDCSENLQVRYKYDKIHQQQFKNNTKNTSVRSN